MDAAIGAARRAFDDDDLVDRPRVPGRVPAPAARGDVGTRRRAPRDRASPRSARRCPHLRRPARHAGRRASAGSPTCSRRYEWETDLGVAAPFGMPSPPLRSGARRSASSARSRRGTSRTRSTSPRSAPALAAGNTVVLKPAPDTPWSATAARPARRRARPTSRRAWSTSSRRRPTTSAPSSSSDPRVDLISFTGSTATGRKIMARGRRPPEEGVPRARRQVGGDRARRRRPRRRRRRRPRSRS